MSPRRLLLLFLAALFFHIAGSWTLPLLDRDEPRFAEASREMRERGDWVVPSFNGQPRYDKPPLIYWMQCAAYSAFGENEFSARLPAALSAALIVIVLALWGARLYDAETGWRAAVIFTLSLQAVAHAHAAVADMPMVLAVAASAWAGWEWRRAKGLWAARVWGCFFWTAMALGFLAKGPIAWLPLVMLIWVPRARMQSAASAAGGWILGSIWMLALVALWGVPALLRTHGDFAAVGLGKHVIGRSVGAMEGHGGGSLLTALVALPFYFIAVWPGFLPWSLWLPGAIRDYARRGLAKGSVERYLFAGVLLVFGIFTLVRTKLPHYTLPAFPFLALLLAAWWRAEARSSRTFWKTAAISAAAILVFALAGLPAIRRLFPVPRLVAQVAPVLDPQTPLAVIDFNEPSVVWLFRRHLRTFPELVSAKKAAPWMDSPGPRACLLSDEMAAKIFPTVPPDWRVMRESGWNLVKGRRVALTLLLKPSTPASIATP